MRGRKSWVYAGALALVLLAGCGAAESPPETSASTASQPTTSDDLTITTYPDAPAAAGERADEIVAYCRQQQQSAPVPDLSALPPSAREAAAKQAGDIIISVYNQCAAQEASSYSGPGSIETKTVETEGDQAFFLTLVVRSQPAAAEPEVTEPGEPTSGLTPNMDEPSTDCGTIESPKGTLAVSQTTERGNCNSAKAAFEAYFKGDERETADPGYPATVFLASSNRTFSCTEAITGQFAYTCVADEGGERYGAN